MSDVPLKRCAGLCGQEYPATTEYFHKNKMNKSGLSGKCKDCMESGTFVYIPESSRRCTGPCGQEYPATIEFWFRSITETANNICRKCLESQQSYYHVAYRQDYYSRSEVKERYRVYNHTRSARKKAISGIHTPEQIQEQLKRQKHRCYYAACGHAKFKKVNGKYQYHIEHTFPLSRVAGSDIPANDMGYLVLACPSCNSSKGNKFPWEWSSGGRLC